MRKYNLLIFIIWLLFFSFFNFNLVYWNWVCEYKWQINQCNEANKSWTTKSIEDFVCVTWTNEQVAYQVILDLEFKKIDNEMDEFIEKLEINKNVYFWKDRKRTYIDWINDIHLKNIYFTKKYRNICSITIPKKVSACMVDKKTSILNAKDFFSNQGTSCRILIDIKMKIFDDIAFGVLMLNKEQIKADEKKTYDQLQRRNYDKLLDIMMINIWYLERIWKKWPAKLANPH